MSINLVKSMWLKCERWNICQLLISGRLLNISASPLLVKMCVIYTLGILILQSMPPALLGTHMRYTYRIQYNLDPGNVVSTRSIQNIPQPPGMEVCFQGRWDINYPEICHLQAVFNIPNSWNGSISWSIRCLLFIYCHVKLEEIRPSFM